MGSPIVRTILYPLKLRELEANGVLNGFSDGISISPAILVESAISLSPYKLTLKHNFLMIVRVICPSN